MEGEIVWGPPAELVKKSDVKRFIDKRGIKGYEGFAKNYAENIEGLQYAVR